MDGFRFCEFVKATFELKDMRIIAMSGVQGAGFEEKILKQGAVVSSRTRREHFLFFSQWN
jgi:hypothetical protein